MNGTEFKNRDWIGNKRSRHRTMGTRNLAQHEREKNDFYRTDPERVEQLLKFEMFNRDIWECRCGEGHISKVLLKHGYNVKSTDLFDRGFGVGGVDFLKETVPFHGDILTNPPYKYRLDFIKKSLDLIDDGRRVCMLLKLQFLEGKKRHEFFVKYPPKTIYVAVGRVHCRLNAEFEKYMKCNAITYRWFIWEKGFTGEPVIRWFNY